MHQNISLPGYEELELLVTSGSDNKYSVRVTGSSAGDGEALCTLHPQDDELIDALGQVESNETDKDLLQAIGQYLFEELFVGDALELYRSNLSIARTHEKHLRIRLTLRPPELAALPWEFLYDPLEELFLATSTETALVRYIPVRIAASPITVTAPLRVLAVFASPTDLPPLQLDAERAILQESLQEHISNRTVELQMLDKVSLATLTQAMRTFRPHIFHFVGHSMFDSEQAVVALDDGSGRALFVDEQAFRELFAGCRETRLVVLNSCETAVTSAQHALIGLAPRLLQRQLPAVVAMQYPISDNLALIFAREFYQSLAVGYGVDAATSFARRGLYLETSGQTRDWASPVLFLRAKDGLLFTIEESLEEQLEFHSPPEPLRPPTIHGFIGREDELNHYQEIITKTGVVVIAGMAGVGKTALATMLAARISIPEKIFWHSFHEDEGIEIIIWKLAGFLAWHGHPRVWQMLQKSGLSGGELPPLPLLFDYLLEEIRSQNYTICLDDFHLVENNSKDSALLQALVDHVRPDIAERTFHLILISRALPRFIHRADYKQLFAPLGGISHSDASALLSQRGIDLSGQIVDALYQSTEGNAELLIMVIDALHRSADPQGLVLRVVEMRNIKRYLLEELDRNLTIQEREIESGIAILGQPSARDVIEATLDEEDLLRPIYGLCDRFLLTQQEGPMEHFGQHSILQAFYYMRPGRQRRQKMHRLAAEYYEHVENEPLRAAQHYFKASEYTQSARLASEDIGSHIYSGNASSLLQLLELFTVRHLEPVTWAEINVAMGEALSSLADHDRAELCNQEALTTLDLLPDNSLIKGLRARAKRGLADAHRYDAPQVAIQWLEQSLDELSDVATHEKVDLLLSLGGCYARAGDNEHALKVIHEGLSVLPYIPKWSQLRAYINLGGIHSYQGDFATGQSYTAKALTLCEELDATYWKIPLLYNRGFDRYYAGDWSGAEEDYNEALDLAIQLNVEDHRANTMNFLGMLYIRKGEFDKALSILNEALILTNKAKLAELQAYILSNKAMLYIKSHRWAEAESILQVAESSAQAVGAQYALIELLNGQVKIYLHTGRVDGAMELAEQALALAQELGIDIELGIAQRTQAQVHAARDEYTQAIHLFEESIASLQESEPYETACTQLAWARYLLFRNRHKDAKALLAAAVVTFRHLGAAADLAESLHLMQEG